MLSSPTTLIIPAYNEGERLARGLERLRTASEEGRFALEDVYVLYVDDGSSDETAAVAERLVAGLPSGKVIRQAWNMGKGAAILAGVRAAITPDLAFIDADFSIDPRQLPRLLAALSETPIAIGSRAVSGRVDYGSRARTHAGRSFNLLIQLLSHVDFIDTQCGFKAFRTAHAKVLFHYVTINRFAFDVELLARARSFGWGVSEVPASWQDVQGSHVRLSKDPLNMIVALARARINFSSLPPLFGVRIPEAMNPSALRSAAEHSPMAHSPLIELANGELVLAAALFPEAQAKEHTTMLAEHLGSTVSNLTMHDIQSAPYDRIRLLTEHPGSFD